jgi:hypothetical protein
VTVAIGWVSSGSGAPLRSPGAPGAANDAGDIVCFAVSEAGRSP